jgi:hypothetical protein
VRALLIAEPDGVPALIGWPLRKSRRLDVAGFGPRQFLLLAKTAAIAPARFRRSTAANMVLARKGLAAILCGGLGTGTPIVVIKYATSATPVFNRRTQTRHHNCRAQIMDTPNVDRQIFSPKKNPIRAGADRPGARFPSYS